MPLTSEARNRRRVRGLRDFVIGSEVAVFDSGTGALKETQPATYFENIADELKHLFRKAGARGGKKSRKPKREKHGNNL